MAEQKSENIFLNIYKKIWWVFIPFVFLVSFLIKIIGRLWRVYLFFNRKYLRKRSTSYFNKEKYVKAIKCNKKIIKTVPPVYKKEDSYYIQAVTNLGELNRLIANFSDSEKYLTEGIEITDPESFDRAVLNIHLGSLYADLGKFKLAEEHYLEAYQKFVDFKKSPYFETVAYDLYTLYTQLGQKELGMRYLNETSSKVPA